MFLQHHISHHTSSPTRFPCALQGAVGMVSQPVQGAEREGLKGFFGGMARGVVGALTAPVTGTLSAFSKVRGSTGQADVAAGWLVWGG